MVIFRIHLKLWRGVGVTMALELSTSTSTCQNVGFNSLEKGKSFSQTRLVRDEKSTNFVTNKEQFPEQLNSS